VRQLESENVLEHVYHPCGLITGVNLPLAFSSQAPSILNPFWNQKM